ncbi:ADP-ribosylation factor GTPase-activating protein 2 isoform X1 [Malaya genurostris]|uniref:ADP-ribosylation factor GTPase-activating protein 2 isoform X1 n=1 Tax=Malaya genurostris TaxID=325434 RepID=UPI0026F3A4A6|nr:ADP-ribosylation factor GTPase-activating protein 2 isoform X1 [Malaya genurostris]XP_058462079.1 ADP-ribosylation factor GTPase-activating protein 2 isoform X1 [Malaya genurostris]XP_058462080.1 ADP-ribosylation factor GTPase-activating protein 2 isoform X1 [Malaya genurostris]
MAVAPGKSDIDAIFNRLRSIPTNKTCFDCGSKNPTWSSVTYGVFICIDCSAVHRSLGVHLTFVRSTNLDTNWTWLQIRQMQLGGNAKASQFFRQHNCNTTDAQQKYNSRAAQLYKDKLAGLAQQSLQLHGNTLHIDNMHVHTAESNVNEEVDFFADCASLDTPSVNTDSHNNNLKQIGTQQEKIPNLMSLGNSASDGSETSQGPSVDFLNSTVPVEPPRSTIGVRKIQPKKGALGGKKGGLGATRVKTNFAEIEEKANMVDKLKMSSTVPVEENPVSEEEQAQALASVRLAYQDLSIKQHKEEEKLKAVDPNKAKQIERLGMGFSSRSGVSHSAITDMKTLTQESTSKNGSSLSKNYDSNNDFFDDYSTSMYGSNASSSNKTTTPTSLKDFSDATLMGFETIEPFDTKHNIQTMFSNVSTAKNSSISDQPTYSRNVSKKSPGGTTEYEASDTAQKKFGTAKGISSDQFFGDENSTFERSANLAKFQGSSSISSADYFGHDSSTGGGRNRGPNLQYNGPDLDDVKESVRHSVTKVAGRLSTLANDVMSSIQDKYGY